jgi:CRP-like cAMP-binding protein
MWRLPLLARLSDEGKRQVRLAGHEIHVHAGAIVVRRWASDRDFYVVLVGQLLVDVDGQEVRRLAAGDFFGELAARDWGSGYGYPRLATVTAQTDASMWVLPPEAFGAILAAESSLREAVDQAMLERLRRS